MKIRFKNDYNPDGMPGDASSQKIHPLYVDEEEVDDLPHAMEGDLLILPISRAPRQER